MFADFSGNEAARRLQGTGVCGRGLIAKEHEGCLEDDEGIFVLILIVIHTYLSRLVELYT